MQGTHLEIEEGEGRVEDDLEDGVDGNQDGTVLGAPVGQLVPQQHHGDAARQAHQNDPGPVVRQIRQRRPCKCHLRLSSNVTVQGLLSAISQVIYLRTA